ncbi:CBO2463/CBO2479 domain-containing protein [Paradesulfitobacterium aromaticivorans]
MVRDNLVRRITGKIIEVSEAGVKVEFSGRMGNLHIPLRLVLSNAKIAVGQSVELNMSYIQVIEE